MNHLPTFERTNFQSVPQKPEKKYFTPTQIKVGAFALGLLLVGAGLAMYFCHVNAVASYAVGGTGGAILLGVAIWSVVTCVKERKHTLDFSQKESPEITEEQMVQLLKDRPNLRTLKIFVRPHRGEDWNPNFGPLEKHFKMNGGESSGTCYIYERK